MKFKMAMFIDAFQGSGEPLAGDPITSWDSGLLRILRQGPAFDSTKGRGSGGADHESDSVA